ncbi:MAG: DNA-processing protein DprA [Candidatus Krumholzibacteriia bacterium]
MSAALPPVRPAPGWRLDPADPGWPPLWREIPDPPAGLEGRGRVACLTRPALAIVGTRLATPRGLAVARRLAGELATVGWVIVSGLARGIDAAAHEGALAAGGETVAFVAHGLDRTYPPLHVGLRARIEAQGCVATELARGTRPERRHFPLRNRLVAGLVQGIVVVEAPARSGALNTAHLGLAYNREVMAVPGPVEARQSCGCHALIRQGAALVASTADVLDLLPPPGPPAGAGPDGPTVPGGEAVRWLWARLDLDGTTVAALQSRWRGAPGALAEALLTLELARLIRRLPGGRVARRIWTS